MNANPMEEQIGRLVGNLLAGGGEIFLPGVGSLYTCLLYTSPSPRD